MPKNNATENLCAKLKPLADAFGEVPGSSGNKPEKEMSKIRSKAEHTLRESRYRLSEASDVIVKQAHEAVAETDSYVRENPQTGVSTGAAVSVVLGVLLSHRQQ